jgi:hypothetical protein
MRVNKSDYHPLRDETGVDYIPIPLVENNTPTWLKSDDDTVDAVILNAPIELWSGKYDVKFINFRNFGTPQDIAKVDVGSQIASAGLVPAFMGQRRNYPIYKFGKIAGIPDEMPFVPCTMKGKVTGMRQMQVWWLAADLIAGNSGSPIFFDPLLPPGADISTGEPRAMIIGMQSIALPPGAALAGMTPASYIIDVISRAVPPDADLSLGLPSK